MSSKTTDMTGAITSSGIKTSKDEGIDSTARMSSNFDEYSSERGVEYSSVFGGGGKDQPFSSSSSELEGKSNSQDAEKGEEEEASNSGEDGSAFFTSRTLWTVPYVGLPINAFLAYYLLYGIFDLLVFVLGPNGRNVPNIRLLQYGNLITVVHTYSFLFGMVMDAFPIFGKSWRPYTMIGWVLYILFVLPIIILNNAIDTTVFVMIFSFAQIGYQLVATGLQAYMPWVTSMEAPNSQGRANTTLGTVAQFASLVNVIFNFLSFSGPNYNCPGYEKNEDVPCTTDEDIMAANELSLEYPENWCHMICPQAIFNFDIGLRGIFVAQAVLIVSALPWTALLNENDKVKKKIGTTFKEMWIALNNRAVWETLLFSVVFNSILAVVNPLYQVFRFRISTRTILPMSEQLIGSFLSMATFIIITIYGMGWSWHKIYLVVIIGGSILDLCRLLFVFDVASHPALWAFLNCTRGPIVAAGSLPIEWAINIVAKPGYEATTTAILGTCTLLAQLVCQTMVIGPIASLFPESAKADGFTVIEMPPELQTEMLHFEIVAVILKLSTIYFLPLFPRQRKEAKEKSDRNETSRLWLIFLLVATGLTLVFTTLRAWGPVILPDNITCMRILGGIGCSADESMIPLYLKFFVVLGFCYGVPTALVYVPIITGKQKFKPREMYL